MNDFSDLILSETEPYPDRLEKLCRLFDGHHGFVDELADLMEGGSRPGAPGRSLAERGARLKLALEEAQAAAILAWQWKISPSGAAHLIVFDRHCMLFTVHGAYPLLESVLFCEGEAFIQKVDWMEENSLALVTFGFLPNPAERQCTCYYPAGNKGYVLLGEVRKLPSEERSVPDGGEPVIELPLWGD